MMAMEWVETTARTVEEAKELLLDQLGVDDVDTEFEILEEPKPGLFGRTKGQARVRARVRPKTPPSRDDRRRRPAKGKGRADAAPSDDAPAPKAAKERAPKDAASEPAPTEAAPRERAPKAASNGNAAPPRDREREPSGPRLASDIAATEAEAFLQGVLDSFGATATIAVTVDEDGDLAAAIDGSGLGRLIGPRGGVISAIEELTRTRLQHVASGGSTPRFRLDVGGYRAARRPHLEELVDDVVNRVRETGQAHVLDVVISSERKLVHDRVAEVADDLRTHSEGEDPVRRVVVSPA